MTEQLIRELSRSKTREAATPSPLFSGELDRARKLMTEYPVPARHGSWLLVLAPHLATRWVKLTPPVCTLGRMQSNTICLPDPEISRFHCRISFDGVFWQLQDATSQNGVFFRDERIAERCLRSGDLLRLGPVHLLFYQGDADGPTTAG